MSDIRSQKPMNNQALFEMIYVSNETYLNYNFTQSRKVLIINKINAV